MNQKTPKNNVTSITDAISSIRGQKKSTIKKKKSKEVVYNSFPLVEGLTEEKTIIGKGIVALNKALFEQTLYESERLGKIRNILSKIEVGLFDPDAFSKLEPVQQLKVFEILRKDSETTVNFLERMQRNSLQVIMVFDIYKKLMETINQSEDASGGLTDSVDKSKVMQVRGALIEMLGNK